MKSFKEYLIESKKVYSFKVKIAGELPEKFQETLKARLDSHSVLTLEKITTTPIQKLPLDFPGLENSEVTVFEVITEYPMTSPQLASYIKEMGVNEVSFRVRGSGEPSEEQQALTDATSSGKAVLDEVDMDKGNTKIKHKDYFGDDFNKNFLKDLSKTAKQQKKDNGQGEYTLSKTKQDKAGAKSAIGS